MATDDTLTGWYGEQDYSDDASTFGDRITVARMARNMTQSQLARRMGIKVQTLANWEDDRSEPRANKLQMLAGLLNVSMIWLMSGEGEGPAIQEVDSSIGRTVDEMVLELREIRAAQTDLAARLGRLEKRLRALGEAE